MIITEATSLNINMLSEIHVKCWREVYHFIPDEIHKARSLEYRKKQWLDVIKKNEFGTKLYVVKQNANSDVVGFCFCKPNHDDEIDAKSELHAAYVLPGYRGGNTGPIMMHKMVDYLLGCQLDPICLWAFDENPITRWYKFIGWTPVVRRQRNICGVEIPETGFVCKDASKLRNRLINLLDKKRD